MLGWLVSQIWEVLRSLLQLLGLVGQDSISDEGQTTRVVVRSGQGRSVELDLEQGWSVKDVKMRLSSQLEVSSPEQLRIIFAGRELGDEVSVDSCDLGNQSILHAVTVITAEAPAAAAPLSQTLVDLQLTGEERISSTENVTSAENMERRAMFYCWCDEEDKLSHAKLRVRCGDCQSGAIILHSDPCSWEDVLHRDRIQGYCELCQHVAYVVFYFRCGSVRHKMNSEGHETVALELIKTNIRHVPCLACTDTCDTVLVFPCDHVTCTDCWADYARSRLGDRQYRLDPDLGYTLPCPLDCEASHVVQPAHFKLMTSHHYQRYLRFGAEELVLQSGGSLCPQPGCGAGILPHPDTPTTCSRLTCGECGYVFCRDCGQGAHLGPCLPCGEEEDGGGGPGPGADSSSVSSMSAMASRSRWTVADPSSVTIRVISKPCPGCRTPTERDGGCMHMICTKSGCGLHWCWVCQVEWTRECMASHWFG